MAQVATRPEIKIKFCVNCGRKLDAFIKDNTCCNTRDCARRVEEGNLAKPGKTFVQTKKVTEIVNAVAAQFNFSAQQLCGPTSEHHYGRARRVLCYLLIEDAQLTAVNAGGTLGNRSGGLATIYKKEVAKSLPDFQEDIAAVRARYAEST